MSAGRTSWWPCDHALLRRELVVELGDEFGGDGVSVYVQLRCWAQEQRAGGEVKGGFRALSRESFVTVSHALSIVSRAAVVGLLDDLQIDSDGRRFTCRISGWKADQERGRAALRQDAKRNKPTEQTVTDPNLVTVGHGPSRSVTASALQENIEVGERGIARAASDLPGIADDVIAVLSQCPRLHVDQVGVTNAIIAWPHRDAIRAARTIVTWASDPAFRSTNAARLLADALSKQTPEATAAAGTKHERTERRLRAVETLAKKGSA